MKLLRYGDINQEKPGILDKDGNIRDLSSIIPDIDRRTLSNEGLASLASLDLDRLLIVEGAPRLGVPISRIGQFVAIGTNYVDHAIEANLPIPDEPIIFTKAITCVSGPNDPVLLPPAASKGDWEVELGVVIGATADHVPEDKALSHVAGYCVVNDVSERDFQFNRGLTWDKGKGCPTFGPIGPWLVTADEISDPQQLDLWLDVNGKPMQRGNTRTMIFSVRQLVSYVSRFIRLEAGDVIATGTPPGVGMGIKPDPVFLKEGDRMTLGIAGLGMQSQLVGRRNLS